MTTHFYTAASLDGFIATEDHSLDWLLKQDFDQHGPMNYSQFLEGMGAVIMGSSTYEWLRREQESWPYEVAAFVLTHRELMAPEGADVRFAQGAIRDVHTQAVEAAQEKDVWVVGGGDVAGQFADARLLDEVWVQFAPVTLGRGRPLLPRPLDLELVDAARNRNFVCTRYRVVKS